MSPKLLKLRCKIFFWTITGRISKLHSRIQLKLSQGIYNNILIIFPLDEPSFRVAYYTFRDLGKKNNQKNKFTFIVRDKFESLFYSRGNEVVFIRESSFDSMLPDEGMIEAKLSKIQYDMIIDLNPNFHLGVSRLVSLLCSDMKIGFESDFSDKFYNIQLNVSKSGIMEKGFKQINWLIAK